MKTLNLDKLKAILTDACYIEKGGDLSPSIAGLLNITSMMFNSYSGTKENLKESCKLADEVIYYNAKNKDYRCVYEFIVCNTVILEELCCDEEASKTEGINFPHC